LRTRRLLYWVSLLLVVGLLLVLATPALAQDGGEERSTGGMFTHIISSAGFFFGPLLFLVSIGLVTLIVLLVIDLRLGAAVPPAFVDDFTDTVNKRQFKQAFDLCRSDGSFLARVLGAGMARLQYGIEDARHAANHMVDSARAGKQPLINYLGTIRTLGP